MLYLTLSVAFACVKAADLESRLDALKGAVSGEPSEYILSFPTKDNPANAKVITPKDKNYVMLLGDWGYPDGTSYGTCQAGVAKKMKSYYESKKAAGYNLVAVVTVGDSFYWTGQDCSLWDRKWRDYYGDIATTVPWLNVFGNHDWGNSDADALCAWNNPKYTDPNTGISYASNQLNKDKGGCNPDNYWLPDFGYYYTINELDFEVIALDTNADDCPNGLGGNGANGGAKYLIANCGGSWTACDWMGKMKTASENMMKDRAKNSRNRNFIIIQHYPGTGANLVDTFKSINNNASNLVWSAYGHTHIQQCDRWDSHGNCDAIMTGGGGGCCNESTRRGFYVVHFDSSGKMTQPLSVEDSELTCWYPCNGEEEDAGQEHADQEETCAHTRDDPNCPNYEPVEASSSSSDDA